MKNPNSSKVIDFRANDSKLVYEFPLKKYNTSKRVNFLDPRTGWFLDRTPTISEYSQNKDKYIAIPLGVYSDVFELDMRKSWIRAIPTCSAFEDSSNLRNMLPYFEDITLSKVLECIAKGWIMQLDNPSPDSVLAYFKIYFTIEKNGNTTTISPYNGAHKIVDGRNPEIEKKHIRNFYPGA